MRWTQVKDFVFSDTAPESKTLKNNIFKCNNNTQCNFVELAHGRPVWKLRIFLGYATIIVNQYNKCFENKGAMWEEKWIVLISYVQRRLHTVSEIFYKMGRRTVT